MLAEFLADEWYLARRDLLAGRSCGWWPRTGWWSMPRGRARTVLGARTCGRRCHTPATKTMSEHYRELFTDVVRRMSRSIGPLACEVSGGLDSSAIFCMARTSAPTSFAARIPVDGYTLAFTDDTDANELDYARAVGEYWGAAIQEIAPSRGALSWYRERARRYRAFPCYPNGVMGLGIRTEAASRGSRALLVGVGGDEWLCGSRSYYAEALATGDWKSLVQCMVEDRRNVGIRRSLYWLLRHGCVPILPNGVRRLLRRVRDLSRTDHAESLAWLAPSLQLAMRRKRNAASKPILENQTGDHQRVQNSTLASAFSANARELEEGLAAGVGIELRRPFFSHQMIQFALNTPQRTRLRGNTDKYLHRKAMAGLLPESVLTRTNKADFMITFQWHHKELVEAFGHRCPGAAARWVDGDHVAEFFAQFGYPQFEGAPEWKLWTLFGCEALISEPANEIALR